MLALINHFDGKWCFFFKKIWYNSTVYVKLYYTLANIDPYTGLVRKRLNVQPWLYICSGLGD